MSLLHRNKTRVSSIASVTRARFGRMIYPLCEKTRSTGAEDAGTQNTYSNNGFSCGNLAHTVDMDIVFLEFWVSELADVVNELLLRVDLSWHATMGRCS